MATEMHRMFGCPVCGYRLNDDDPSCPRCNNKLETGMKLECPFCGELVDPRVRECPVCHVDYLEFKEKTIARGSDSNIDELLNEIIKMESMQIKEEPKKYSCPDCSWLLDGSETACPKCGRDLTNEYAFQCPICGSPVQSDASSCPECGAVLENGPTKTQHEVEQPKIDELESFAKSVRTTKPQAEPERAPEPPAIVDQPAPSPPEEPVVAEAPAREEAPPEMPEPVATAAAEPDKPAEATSAKPAAPKSKKRKLKAKSAPKLEA